MSTTQKSEIKNLKVKPVGYYSNSRSEMLQFIPQSASKILDAGCGEGSFASEVKKHMNAEVWGLELDSDSAKKAGAKIDKVFQGDLSETITQLPNNYFDCIVFNDVLEHLVNPYDVLTLIRQKLSSNGVVVCSIPNVRYWRVFKKYIFAKQWKYEDNGVLDKTHLRFFTKKSIQNMFDELKYEVMVMKGLNPTPSVMFHVVNTLTLLSLNDCKYVQYACVVRPR